jgi:hypothetical protein
MTLWDSLSPNAGKGKGIAWLRAHADYAGDDCVIWPYSRDDYGYGQCGFNGQLHKAPTLMCELVHGQRPTRKHEAAHECGNGRGGCVNPRHLAWKTRKENAADMLRHGTARTDAGRKARKLTVDQVREILTLKGSKSQREIARMYGVTNKQISKIHLGQQWRGGQYHKPGGHI